MSDTTPQPTAGHTFIEAYGEGGFRIGGRRVVGSFLVFSGRVEAWAVTRFDEVSFDSFAPLLAAAPPVETLIVGCGTRPPPAPPAVRDDLRAAGIVADFMDTGAACRTFNVLLAERRRVAAALIAVD